jgi:hypothetical protein
MPHITSLAPSDCTENGRWETLVTWACSWLASLCFSKAGFTVATLVALVESQA